MLDIKQRLYRYDADPAVRFEANFEQARLGRSLFYVHACRCMVRVRPVSGD